MSAVRVTKIRDFDVTPPRKSAFQIETPPDVPRQHSLTIFSARRGGGKSVACTTYVKKLLEVGAMQRVMIITPTWASNKDIFAPLNIQEEDVIEPSKSALATVVSRVEQEKKDHDENKGCERQRLEAAQRGDLEAAGAVSLSTPRSLTSQAAEQQFGTRPDDGMAHIQGPDTLRTVPVPV